MSKHGVFTCGSLLVLLFLLVCQSAPAATFHVPGDQPTIQAGIDAASEADTVLVAPGTYKGDGNRDIDFGGKNVVLKSEEGAEITIIDCEHKGRGFHLHSGEDSSAVIDGFTVRGGRTTGYGAGAGLSSCAPTFTNCIFESNSCVEVWGRGLSESPYFGWYYECYWISSGGGGAVACFDAFPTFTNCRFAGNYATWGGAIYARDSSSLRIHNSIISRNTARSGPNVQCDRISDYGPGSAGGGVYCATGSSVVLDHCTIVRNNRATGLGFFHYGNGSAIFGGGDYSLVNCVVAFNGSSSNPSGRRTIAAPHVVLSRCDLFGNSGGDWVYELEDQLGVNGNFSADPLFCDTASGEYSLDAASPCLPPYGDGGEWIGALGVGCGDYVCGDVNWDGVLSDADLAQLTELYFFRLTDWFLPVAASDMDCNGLISINDLVLLSGYIHGWGPTPCCVPPPPPKPPMEEKANHQSEDT